LVVTLALRVIHPPAALVVEAHGARSVHLVAYESRMTIDQVDAPAKAVLEVDLVSSSDGNAIGDDDHAPRLRDPERATNAAPSVAARGRGSRRATSTTASATDRGPSQSPQRST